MNKWAELFLGLTILIGVVLFSWYSVEWGSFWNFRHAAWIFLKGGLVWFLVFIGAVFILLGINDIKNN